MACMGVVLAVFAAGCAERAAVPPPAPSLGTARPAVAIPADLDVALRIDLVGARQALGPDISRQLELGVSDPKKDPVASAMLAAVLDRAETIWVAFRPGLAAQSTDNVIVARGEFKDLDPRSFKGDGAWGPPSDLGGDVRLYERAKPSRRSAPARVYVSSTSVVVFVSEAEIDSVERNVEHGAGDPHLDPPERGTISIAARMPPIAAATAERFPVVARVLAEATELEGWLDTKQSGMKVELAIEFIGSEEARAASQAAEDLRKLLAAQHGPWSLVAKAAKAEVVGQTLVLRANFTPEGVGQLIACFAYGTGCDDSAK